MTKILTKGSLLPYLLLIISIFLLFMKSNLTTWSILAFILVSLNIIDKKHENMDKEKKYIVAKKNLNITYRIFLSITVIFIIINNFFIELDTAFVLYTLLLISLTSLLTLTNIKE